MCVNERENSEIGSLQGVEVVKVQEFKYPKVTTVQSSGDSGREVKNKLQAGWNSWKKVSGVICHSVS